MLVHLLTYLPSLVALYILTRLISPFLSPLRSIPGPFLARFSRIWLFYRVWLGRADLDLAALHEKHGPIVRYGPKHYSFSDPEAIKIIYGKGTEFDKSSWYEAWNDPGFKTIFTEPSVKAHGQLRRKFQSTYTMSSMVHYESFADHCIDLLCKRLEEIARASGRTDLARWLLSYAGDAVSMMTYSRRMGFLDAGEDVGGLFHTLNKNALYAVLVGIYAEIHPWIFNITLFLKKLKLTAGSPRMFISSFGSKLVNEKTAERSSSEKLGGTDTSADDSSPKDFLSKFLDFHEQDPSRFTERDIHIGLASNVIAGSDTTAAALTAIYYCLLKNPAALAKLQNEISSASSAGQLSSPSTFKETHELPYLQAVIQEAMRLHPPVGLPLQRVVPASGYEICGHFFPAGTVVGVHCLALHHNTSIFGDDAGHFRPERWLDSDKDRLSGMQRHWIPFGLGTRTCIGKNISLLEISKSVPEVFCRFDFTLADGLEREGKEMEWINRWFVRPVTLPVTVHLREIPDLVE